MNGITSPDDSIDEIFEDDQVPEDAEIVGEPVQLKGTIDDRLRTLTLHHLRHAGEADLVDLKADLLELSNHAISTYKAEQKAAGLTMTMLLMRALTPMQIALVMLHRHSIIRMVIGAEEKDYVLSIYDDDEASDTYGMYVSALLRSDFIAHRILELNHLADEKTVKEVYAQLKFRAPLKWRHQDADVMPMANCLVKYPSLEVVPFSPEYVIDRKAATKWVENPPEPQLTLDSGLLWDHRAFIDDLVTDPGVALVCKQAVIAACRPFHLWTQSLWPFNASGNNGKGTMGELIKALVGEHNAGVLSMADYAEPFLLSSLATKMCNVADENDVDARVVNSGKWKTIRTGGVVMAGAKYEKDYKFRVAGIDWQPLNHFLKVADATNSLWRRALPLTFDKEFEGIERPEIRDRLIHDPSYLEWLVWTLAHELEAFERFTVPASSVELITEMKLRNDPVRAFWDDIHEDLVWDLVPRDFLHELYVAWCQRHRPSAIGKMPNNIEFWDRLCRVVLETGSDEWTVTKKTRPGTMMNDPEPLILEWDLKNWKSKTAQTALVDDVCTTTLKEFYPAALRRRSTMPGLAVVPGPEEDATHTA